tara:strand:+ start:412 stop:627 length:216 start_codon:yes stop_codon:yes gene_type:complete
MKLSHWIKQNSLTQKTFYEECKIQGADFSIHALGKWCNGQRIPRVDEMKFITKITNEEVMPNDFYELTNER